MIQFSYSLSGGGKQIAEHSLMLDLQRGPAWPVHRPSFSPFPCFCSLCPPAWKPLIYLHSSPYPSVLNPSCPIGARRTNFPTPCSPLGAYSGLWLSLSSYTLLGEKFHLLMALWVLPVCQSSGLVRRAVFAASVILMDYVEQRFIMCACFPVFNWYSFDLWILTVFTPDKTRWCYRKDWLWSLSLGDL